MTGDVTDERRRWIAAGIALAKDAEAKVLCPKCGDAFLEVEDVPYEGSDGMFARYLRCSKCGAVEILDRLRRS